jgi:NADH dehydrogenase/NADH:ubiquinone oxidoreductase subunit G
MMTLVPTKETIINAKTAYINGKAFDIREGETVLAFLKRHKGEKYVPTLCDAPNLEPFGACRVCSVEIARPGNGPDSKPSLPAIRPSRKG